MALITEHDSPCELCEDKEKPPKKKTDGIPDWDDDPDGAIDNSSGKLETSMAGQGDPRPTDWRFTGKLGRRKVQGYNLIPNPHHLVPGNESLKESDIQEWIFESDKIEADIGYDVNNYMNGIWLPSNNEMRGDGGWEGIKAQYAIRAMRATKLHFHDRHVTYSKFVTKILNKIAARMDGAKDITVDCPYNKKKGAGGKFKPPYYLYWRINGVSTRLRGYLSAGAQRQDFVYTSELVKEYWDAEATEYLEE